MRKMRASTQLHAWGCSRLQLERESGSDEDNRIADPCNLRVRPALPVTKLTPEFVLRRQPHANLVGNEDRRAGERADRVGQARDSRREIPACQHEIAKPE